MSESPIVLPNWIQTAFGWLASAIAGGAIVRIYTAWLNRHKPAAETHLTKATATEAEVRAGASAGDAVMRMMTRLDEAQGTIDRLRQERDAWQKEYDVAFTERVNFMGEAKALQRKVSDLQGEIQGYEVQIRKMQATLLENRINYDNTQDAKPEDYTLPPKE